MQAIIKICQSQLNFAQKSLKKSYEKTIELKCLFSSEINYYDEVLRSSASAKISNLNRSSSTAKSRATFGTSVNKMLHELDNITSEFETIMIELFEGHKESIVSEKNVICERFSSIQMNEGKQAIKTEDDDLRDLKDSKEPNDGNALFFVFFFLMFCIFLIFILFFYARSVAFRQQI